MTGGAARRTAFLGLAPALLFVVVAWPALRESSATYDETEHVPAGYTYVTRGDYRLGPEHPPLVKLLTGLALLGQTPTVSAAAERAFTAAPRDIDAHWIFGYRLLYADNAPEPLLWRARVVVLGLGALLVLVVFAWGRALFGTAGGLLASTAAALDPNLLAHGTLATTDLGFTCFFVLALYGVSRVFRCLTTPTALGAGLAIAAAFASKHSAALLVPCIAVLGTIRVMSAAPWPTRPGADATTATGRLLRVIALLVLWSTITGVGIWTVYGFRYAATADGAPTLPIATWASRIREIGITREHLVAGTPIPPPAAIRREAARRPPSMRERAIVAAHEHRLVPEAYSFGLAFATAMAQVRRGFLLGEISLTGWTGYFPFAFLVKTPLATLALLTLGLAGLGVARSRSRGNVRGDPLDVATIAAVIVPPCIVMGAAMSASLNIGYRHILPMLPFVYIAIGSAPRAVERLAGRRAAMGLCTLALVGLTAETAATRPHFLSFFNAAAGGARGGLSLLSDSNLDWGQGLPALRRWMREQQVEQVNLAYFGTADPSAYGIRFVPLAGSYRLAVPGAGAIGHTPRRPELPGWVAVSATHMQGTYLLPHEHRAYEPLRTRAPDAVVAGSIYLYWMEEWPH